MKEELPPEVKNWSEIMDEQERARKRIPIEIKVTLALLTIAFAVVSAWLIKTVWQVL